MTGFEILVLIAGMLLLGPVVVGVVKNKDHIGRTLKKDLEPKFTIEYYSEIDRYYPKYGNKYLRKLPTGIVTTEPLFEIADSKRTKEGAENMIRDFKHHKLKEGVQVLKVD